MLNTDLHAGLSAALTGKPIFPCKGKEPLIKNNLKSASADPWEIEAWQKQFPGCNWGVVTGGRSGFWVFDVDAKPDEDTGLTGFQSLAALEAEHGPLPKTMVVKTQSGGRHFYFEWPEGCKIASRAKDIGPGLDSRGGRENGEATGYVIAPGSPGYEVVSGEDLLESGLPQAPDWLLFLVIFNRRNRAKLAELGIHGAKDFAGAPPRVWRGSTDLFLSLPCPEPKAAGEAPAAVSGDAVLKYVMAAIKGMLSDLVAEATDNHRNEPANITALKIHGKLKAALEKGADVGAVADLEHWARAEFLSVCQRIKFEFDKRNPDELAENLWQRCKTDADPHNLDHVGRGREVGKAEDQFAAVGPGGPIGIVELGQQYGGILPAGADAQAVEAINREYAAVELGGHFRIIARPLDAKDGDPWREPISVQNFSLNLANIRIRDFDDPEKLHAVAARWITDNARRMLRRGYEFMPDQSLAEAEAAGYANSFTGWPIAPREGDIGRFTDYVKDIVCAGNHDHAEWLLDWLADITQHPARKPGTAVVLYSEQQGTGKTTLFEILAGWPEDGAVPAFSGLLGRYAGRASSRHAVATNFNADRGDKLVIGVEEVVLGRGQGAADLNGELKDRITAPTVRIERKGIDATTVRDCARYIFSGNSTDIVNIGPWDRRFAVFEVSATRARDRKYFGSLRKWIAKEGGAAAIMHFLRTRKIENDVSAVPNTGGRSKLIVASLNGVDRWLYELASTGEARIREHGQDTAHALSVGGSTRIPKNSLRLGLEGYVGRGLAAQEPSTVLAKCGVIERRTRERESRIRNYEFPPLPDFRAQVAALLRVPIAETPCADAIETGDEGGATYRNITSFRR